MSQSSKLNFFLNTTTVFSKEKKKNRNETLKFNAAYEIILKIYFGIQLNDRRQNYKNNEKSNLKNWKFVWLKDNHQI